MVDIDLGITPETASATGNLIGSSAGAAIVKSLSESIPGLATTTAKGFIDIMGKDAFSGMTATAKEAANHVSAAGGDLKGAIDKSADKLAFEAEKAAKAIFKELSGKELTLDALVDLDTSKLLDKARGLGENAMGDVLVGIGIDPASVEMLKGSLGIIQGLIEPMLKQEVFVEIAVGKGMKAMDNILSGVSKTIGTFEAPLLAANREAVSLAIPFMKLSGAGGGLRDVSDALVEYRERMVQASKQTGLSATELTKLEHAFVSSGVSAEEMSARTKLSFDNNAGDLTGLAAAAVAFKGAGLDAADGATEMSFAMRNLGLSSNEALERLGIFAEVSNRTPESMTKVTETITRGAASLKYYGDTTKGVAEVYDKFLKTVGEGKEGLAADFVQTIVSGIGGMNEGLKAFIGQTSGLGAGQGAIGGMLEVEEQIADGNIQGVMDALTKQIETISGTSILGRQEAISTGSQEQFFIQRKLLQDFLNVQDPEQATRLMENISRGQDVMASDLKAARGLAGVGSRGQQSVQAELGVSQRLQNVADVTRNLGLTQSIAKALQESSGNFKPAADTLLQSVEGLQSLLNKDLSEVLISGSQLESKMNVPVADAVSELSSKDSSGITVPGLATNLKHTALENQHFIGDIGESGKRASLLGGISLSSQAELGKNNFDQFAMTGFKRQNSEREKELSTLAGQIAELAKSMDSSREFKGQNQDELKDIVLRITIDPTKMEQVVKGQIERKEKEQVNGR